MAQKEYDLTLRCCYEKLAARNGSKHLLALGIIVWRERDEDREAETDVRMVKFSHYLLRDLNELMNKY